MQDPADLLGADGPLAHNLPGFHPRTPQREMAAAVAQAMARQEHLIVEAGTGTGKTFAYLVPALAGPARVIVSTGTRTLQDQLYFKDLPRLRQALKLPLRAALLKGRNNYLCPYHLQQNLHSDLFAAPTQRRKLQRIQEWARASRHGDIAEFPEISEEDPVWALATSTPDNCLGQACPDLENCHLAKARKRALEADLVVVNHHLLFADLALKEQGFGELLPEADAFVIDEAHLLPPIAADHFGTHLGSRQLLELARDSLAAAEEQAPERVTDYQNLRQTLANALDTLREHLPQQPGRHSSEELETEAFATLAEALSELEEHLEKDAQRGTTLATCHRRAEQLNERLTRLRDAPPSDHVRWLEIRPRSYTLHLTPLEVGRPFRRVLDERPAGWIFTSATLTTGEGDFHHYQRTLGLEDVSAHTWESPYDYRRNALLLCPEDIPPPNAPDHTEAVVETAIPLIEAAGGRTFLLFTSHRALQEAAHLLRERLDLPLWVQGEGARGHLLARFREAPRSVLLGTRSFWEGVDVPGPALSCVIIDKLPFPSPGDPIIQARTRALRARGEDPFHHHALPEAVTALRQGVGRLIRGPEDRGVMVICDTRLVEKHYGHRFIEALPPMARTRRLPIALAFLRHHLGNADPSPSRETP